MVASGMRTTYGLGLLVLRVVRDREPERIIAEHDSEKIAG